MYYHTTLSTLNMKIVAEEGEKNLVIIEVET